MFLLQRSGAECASSGLKGWIMKRAVIYARVSTRDKQETENHGYVVSRRNLKEGFAGCHLIPK
jgi:hypothetical protein